MQQRHESTLWAAVVNAHRTASNVVYLTCLGGGAFGNEPHWIRAAIRRALSKVTRVGLDVRLVSHGTPDHALLGLVEEFG